MTSLKKWAHWLVLSCVLLGACNSTPEATTEEKTAAKSMDSTSRVVETTKEKLEERTKAVEASLEKLDKTFDTTQ